MSRSVFSEITFKWNDKLNNKVRASCEPQSESAVDIVFVQCKAAHTKLAILGARSMFKQVKERVIISKQET